LNLLQNKRKKKKASFSLKPQAGPAFPSLFPHPPARPFPSPAARFAFLAAQHLPRARPAPIPAAQRASARQPAQLRSFAPPTGGPHLSGVSSTSRSSPPLPLGLARAPLCRWPSFQARPARRGSRNPLRARIPTTLHPSPRPNRTRLEPESWSCTPPNFVACTPRGRAPL